MKTGINILDARGTPQPWEKDYDHVGWINPHYKYALVRVGDKWGIVNKSNRIQVPIEFDEIDWPYQNEYYAVSNNGKWGVYHGNYEQELIIPIKYDDIPIIGKNDTITIGDLKFKNERTNDGWKWIARDYSEYDKAYTSGRDCVVVLKDGKYGIITRDKKVLVPIKYNKISSFGYDNLLNVYADKAVGVFDADKLEWFFEPNDFIRIYHSNGRYQFVYGDFIYERRAYNADKYDWIKELFIRPELYR